MQSPERLPALKTIKLQAKRLRLILTELGNNLTHSQSLEIIARQWGYSDWNTLHALLKVPATPENLSVGEMTTGQYMGQAFEAEILEVTTLGNNDAYSVTLKLESPVEILNSNNTIELRQKITCTVGANGKTVQRMPDGTRHLVLDI